MTVQIQQKPAFKRAYRSLHTNPREAFRAIVADPCVGREKKGDLGGVFVHKFDWVNQQYLLA